MPRTALATLSLIAALLTGCEGETRREVQDDGTVQTDFEVGLDDEVDAREALSDVGEELEGAGETLRDAAREAGAEVEAAVNEAGDAIDRNVDLGDDAEDM
ncbi:hypothetical protein [Rubrivirga sp. IMCC43871]|uniref:hypothetical protein n=1 Tax=Rubrivirga sp. IMCC43871 TaxID=3391575 RepID=UPI0039902EA0